MIVYVASALPLRARARAVAADLREAGIRVVSSWHAQSTATVEAERRLSDEELDEIWTQCRAEIAACDWLVIIIGPETTRHGSFCEAECAFHYGKNRVALRPYGASAKRPASLARVPEARTVDELLRVLCGGPVR